jgi:serine/threonine-protein kinase
MQVQSGADNKIGKIIGGGRYRLERLLGEGGMGAVYEATASMYPGQRFAIKLLHEDMASNPNVVGRFLSEGEVCRRLAHPSILRVFEVANENGVPFLVMELLGGNSLYKWTSSQQRLPPNFAIEVTRGVLDALSYAHSQGVIHRDLKPENIHIVQNAQGGFGVKLLDFGIARLIEASGGPRRTATGVLLGTPGYMSPEQVKAPKTADLRTDLWAVGVMFFEMLTGAVAFSSPGVDPANVWGLISAVLTRDPPTLASFDPSLARFDPFLVRALAKDPNQRFQSAAEMAAALTAGAGSQMPPAPAKAPQIALSPGAPRVATFGTVDANFRPATPLPTPAASPGQGPPSAPDPYGATAYHPSFDARKAPSNPPAAQPVSPSPPGRANTPARPRSAQAPMGATMPTGGSMPVVALANLPDAPERPAKTGGLLVVWIALVFVVVAVAVVIVLAALHVI